MDADEVIESTRVALGERVQAIRKKQGLTQEQLATASGMGWRHLQKIEAGEVNLTLSTVCRIAVALNSAPAALFR